MRFTSGNFKDKDGLYDTSAIFPKLDKCDRNKGHRVSLAERKKTLNIFFDELSSINRMPKQFSNLFSGSNARLYHILFDDISDNYNGARTPQNLITEHIKSVLPCPWKESFLSFEQEIVVFEYHRFACIIKLGVEFTYNFSSVIDVILKSDCIQKVCNTLFFVYINVFHLFSFIKRFLIPVNSGFWAWLLEKTWRHFGRSWIDFA